MKLGSFGLGFGAEKKDESDLAATAVTTVVLGSFFTVGLFAVDAGVTTLRAGGVGLEVDVSLDAKPVSLSLRLFAVRSAIASVSW